MNEENAVLCDTLSPLCQVVLLARHIALGHKKLERVYVCPSELLSLFECRRFPLHFCGFVGSGGGGEKLRVSVFSSSIFEPASQLLTSISLCSIVFSE